MPYDPRRLIREGQPSLDGQEESPVGEIVGLPGELVDRLIKLLNCDALGDVEWCDLSFYVVFFIGGATLADVVPDTGKDHAPGSVGEWTAQRSDLVSRDKYFKLIRDRLGELVVNGVEEAFLVRSMRDGIRQELEHLADVGEGDRNRAKVRGHIERTAASPATIAAFRTQLATTDPSAEELSDEEIATRLNKLAESEFLLPVSPDAALDRWSALTHWDEQAASLLPDAVFEQWRLQMARRLN